VRRLPFAFAHERWLDPADLRQSMTEARVAYFEVPVLPERLAGTGAPPPVRSLSNGCRDALGLQEERRKLPNQVLGSSLKG